jgi:predicted lysophospholipase L1 biosynthesis ABC-type transport system permease subunit
MGDRIVDARLSRVAEAVARTSLSPVAGIGVRFGLEPGRGGRAVPLVSAMVGAVVAVAALGAVLTFGASLDHLLVTPRQQGWNWDVLVGNPNTLTDQEAKAGPMLAHNRFVGAYSAIALLAGGRQGNVVIDGKVVDLLLAFDPLKGSVYPPLLEGRAPRAVDEIVLASQTLEKLHRQIGESVRVDTPEGPRALRIVGRMISPSVGDLLTNNMGTGGWVYGPAVRAQQAAAPSTPNATPPTVFTLFAVRYAPSVSPAAAFASLRRDFGPTVLRQLPSEDVINLQSVDRLPALLAGLVVVLGVTTVGNTLVASVRQRRRDLAILKTIGFVRRQVAAVVAWQATSFCLVALLVGLPLGVAGGRWAWNLVVSGIGSASPPVVPTTAIAIVVPAALLVANAVAAWPGWAAAQVAPALVMRSE